MNTEKKAQYEAVLKAIPVEGTTYTTRIRIAEELVEAGCRFADGFEIIEVERAGNPNTLARGTVIKTNVIQPINYTEET